MIKEVCFRLKVCSFRATSLCHCVFVLGVIPTAGEELWPEGGYKLTLEGLREGALCALHSDVSLFDPTQEPQQVAVTKQERRLKLSGD